MPPLTSQVDIQHAPTDYQLLGACITAVNAAGKPALVRVEGPHDRGGIQQASRCCCWPEGMVICGCCWHEGMVIYGCCYCCCYAIATVAGCACGQCSHAASMLHTGTAGAGSGCSGHHGADSQHCGGRGKSGVCNVL